MKSFKAWSLICKSENSCESKFGGITKIFTNEVVVRRVLFPDKVFTKDRCWKSASLLNIGADKIRVS